MKLGKKAGATSEIWQIWIADTSSTTGAGLTGLVFNSASLTAYYHRDTDTTATAIALVTMTVGTFTSSGFKEIDATNMPGWYQFCPPDAAIAAGAKSCAFYLKGATNMAPLAIEVQLTATDVDSATAFMTSVGSVVGAVGSVTGNVGGNVVGSVASVTARVTANTDQLAGQTVTAGAGVTFPASVASPTNITAGVITTTTSLTNLPSIPANWLTAAGIAAAALNGKGDWNIGKTGYALSAAGVQAIWDALTSALTTVGSIGKLIVTNLDALISSRMATYTQPTGFLTATFPTTVASPGLVWDEAIAGHAIAGSTGAALSAAGSAGDPWTTPLPGAYGAGTAGNIVGTNLDATVSTRSTFAGGAVASVTGNVGGNVAGSVGSVVANVNADLKKINGTTVNGDGSGTPWGP